MLMNYNELYWDLVDLYDSAITETIMAVCEFRFSKVDIVRRFGTWQALATQEILREIPNMRPHRAREYLKEMDWDIDNFVTVVLECAQEETFPADHHETYGSSP